MAEGEPGEIQSRKGAWPILLEEDGAHRRQEEVLGGKDQLPADSQQGEGLLTLSTAGD